MHRCSGVVLDRFSLHLKSISLSKRVHLIRALIRSAMSSQSSKEALLLLSGAAARDVLGEMLGVRIFRGFCDD